MKEQSCSVERQRDLKLSLACSLLYHTLIKGEAAEVTGGAGFPGATPRLSEYLHSCDLANGSDVEERHGKKCFSFWYWLSKPRRHCANSEK